MKAVAYCRYSSENQRDGYSIEAQVSAIKDYCHKGKIELLKFYIDEAQSAKTDNRDAFQQMMDDAKKSDWNYVIVHKLDRFARNRYDSALYKKLLMDLDIKVISVLEHLDDSPESVILEGLLESMAEYYSKNLAREVKKGLDERAKKFVAVNGAVPYGYKLINDKYEIVPEEALIIKELYERIAKGETPAEVMRSIASRGVKTRKGNSFDIQKPLRLLANPIYKGSFVHRDEIVDDVIPAIVSKDLWDQVQRVHEKNIDFYSAGYKEAKARKKEGYYLLTGYTHCGICGNHFFGHKSTAKNRNPGTADKLPYYISYSYRCATKANAKTNKQCTSKMIKKDLLEDFTQELIEACVFSDETLNTIVVSLEALINSKKTSVTDSKVIKKKLSELNTKESRLLDLYLSGSINKETYDNKSKEIRTTILSLEAELNKTTTLEYFPKDKIKSTLLEVLNENKSSDTYRVHLFNTFLEKIVIYADRLEYTFKLPILNGSTTASFNKDVLVRRDTSSKVDVYLHTTVSFRDFSKHTLIFTHPLINLSLNQRI